MYFEGYELAITAFGLLVILVGWISYRRGYSAGFRDAVENKKEIDRFLDV